MQEKNSRKPPARYACIRVVRKRPGAPSKPRIVLPAGYELIAEGNYEAASAGEYYVFLKGPGGVAAGVRVDWPDVEIEAVVHDHRRLKLVRRDGAVFCDIPVRAASARGAWATLAIWTHLNEEALPIRIEHNLDSRRLGRYAQGPWVAGPAAACINYLIACRQILRDWGLHRQIKSDGVGHLSLMGFESNNPLHGDWPPHWHLIYYWPPPKDKRKGRYHGSQVPHFYMDERGRTVANSIHVFGGRGRTAKARDPMTFTDPNGTVRFAIDIREDGGVDLGRRAGDWMYSIVAGGGRTDFTRSVRVLRRGKPWLRVSAKDDTARGILTLRIAPLDGNGRATVETYRYDPLTGSRLATPKGPTAPAAPAPAGTGEAASRRGQGRDLRTTSRPNGSVR